MSLEDGLQGEATRAGSHSEVSGEHPATEDLTGRKRLVSNVLFGWGTYGVFIVAGFIVPRLIDRRLGQELLGVWDFAWSLVGYFELVQAGIGSSVNRYVARYRVARDTVAMNGVVSSATAMLAVSGSLVVGLTIGVSLLLPQLFGGRLEENVRDAQWVVFFLGASIAVRVALGAFNGVLTGCHCWTLHNFNTSAWHAAMVAGLVIALMTGAGLRTLALIACMGEVLASLTRLILAHRVCNGLWLQLSLVRRATIRQVFFFGGKTLIPSVSQMLLHQTTGILIAGYLGPAALALYSRPQSLVRHLNVLLNKMAVVLTPTASSLQSLGDMGAIRELLVKSVCYALYMALPAVLVLVVFGNAVMQLWMGSRYANSPVPAILAIGFFASMAQTPVRSILAGLNAHGRVGVVELLASIMSVAFAFVALSCLQWGLTGVALAVALPLGIMNVLYMPSAICRRVGLGVKEYLLSVALGPVVHVLPFAVCLVGARLLFSARPLAGLTWGGVVGSLVLAVSYYRYVLPEKVKVRVSRLVNRGRSVA